MGEGGQSLIHVSSEIMASRLQELQKFMYRPRIQYGFSIVQDVGDHLSRYNTFVPKPVLSVFVLKALGFFRSSSMIEEYNGVGEVLFFFY